MTNHAKTLKRRVEALQMRIESLSSLRPSVNLPSNYDITKRQWTVLETEMKAVEIRLQRRLNRGARAYLAQSDNRAAARSLNAQLGEIELEMTKAFAFFDTFMDVLTQRHTPELGRLLAGCDVLARDAFNKQHPALAIVEPPLVYCDRGFGASTLREGVSLPGRGRNPLPLIQIPYSRLKEKYNLTSVLHEAGHEVAVRCGLTTALPMVLRDGLMKADAPAAITDLFMMWSSEIGPDFWTFCSCGLAEAGAIKEILALPAAHVFRVSWTDPHPPPYLRALLSFEWCRQVWGSGVWDDWEKEWIDLYPLKDAPQATQDLIRKIISYLPAVSSILLRTKFRVLNGRTIPGLFNLSALAPAELKRRIGSSKNEAVNLRGLPPSAHLAVFRLLKEQGKLSEESLDRLMTNWLLRLAEQSKQVHGLPKFK
ncbi:MAG TPA: hypothetical protein VF571_04680 [Pyrinomonadaceae bacterium]|jgi:hypothetical protein